MYIIFFFLHKISYIMFHIEKSFPYYNIFHYYPSYNRFRD